MDNPDTNGDDNSWGIDMTMLNMNILVGGDTVDEADDTAHAIANWLKLWLDPADVLVHAIDRAGFDWWLAHISIKVHRDALPK